MQLAKVLIAKTWKSEAADLAPGTHYIDEVLTTRISGSVVEADQDLLNQCYHASAFCFTKSISGILLAHVEAASRNSKPHSIGRCLGDLEHRKPQVNLGDDE